MSRRKVLLVALQLLLGVGPTAYFLVRFFLPASLGAGYWLTSEVLELPDLLLSNLDGLREPGVYFAYSFGGTLSIMTLWFAIASEAFEWEVHLGLRVLVVLLLVSLMATAAVGYLIVSSPFVQFSDETIRRFMLLVLAPILVAARQMYRNVRIRIVGPA